MTERPANESRRRRLSAAATKRLIIFLVALAIGISLWATYAIYSGTHDEEFQQQLEEIRESLRPESDTNAAPR